MISLREGNYEANIRANADGWFQVSFCYHDGEGRAAVPSLKHRTCKTMKAAEKVAKQGLAKVA